MKSGIKWDVMKLIKNTEVSEKLQGQATTADLVNDVVSWEGLGIV